MLPLFFIFILHFIRVDIYCIYIHILLVEYPLLSSWLPGLLWGDEPRFELGPAWQQADALLPEPRRTQVWATPHPSLSHAAPESEPRRTRDNLSILLYR